MYPALEVNEVGLETLLVTRAVSFVGSDDILLVFCLAIFVYFLFYGAGVCQSLSSILLFSL